MFSLVIISGVSIKLIISWVNMTLEGNMNQRVSVDVSRTGIAL
jgi:hypothetical protein